MKQKPDITGALTSPPEPVGLFVVEPSRWRSGQSSVLRYERALTKNRVANTNRLTVAAEMPRTPDEGVGVV